ncbi:hypothetical protein JOL62DRAFT_255761 [Phyllosticta paracitricarpa]|uniref:F-box domain-containing protein n=1 Tax=Phyllosticta paracitricarpa TaxID=2016321 RepID=A0ABR1MXZ5_9PEZI
MSSAKCRRLNDSQPADTVPLHKAPGVHGQHGTLALGDFPAEILISINDHLPIESSLSLAATCKDLRQLLLPRIEQAARKGLDRTKIRLHLILKTSDIPYCRPFLDYLKRDSFARAIEFERRNEGGPLRACSVCAKLHDACAFSATQLVQPPETRECGAVQGEVFRLCKHQGMAWNFPRNTREYGQYLTCTICGDGMFSYWNRRRHEGYISRTHGAVTIRVRWTLLMLEEGETITGKDVSNRLGQLCRKVCPHTVTQSDHFVNINNFKFENKIPSTDYITLFGCVERCTYPGCKTEFYLNRVAHEIELVVERDVGLMEDATDPAWLVQCGLL